METYLKVTTIKPREDSIFLRGCKVQIQNQGNTIIKIYTKNSEKIQIPPNEIFTIGEIGDFELKQELFFDGDLGEIVIIITEKIC